MPIVVVVALEPARSKHEHAGNDAPPGLARRSIINGRLRDSGESVSPRWASANICGDSFPRRRHGRSTRPASAASVTDAKPTEDWPSQHGEGSAARTRWQSGARASSFTGAGRRAAATRHTPTGRGPALVDDGSRRVGASTDTTMKALDASVATAGRSRSQTTCGSASARRDHTENASSIARRRIGQLQGQHHGRPPRSAARPRTSPRRSARLPKRRSGRRQDRGLVRFTRERTRSATARSQGGQRCRAGRRRRVNSHRPSPVRVVDRPR
jgi:hypothetical protein